MHITIIAASTRNNSQSRRVADYLSNRFSNAEVIFEVVDLSENKLPLYDATDEGSWEDMWADMSQSFARSDGFVFVSPEWDGMFSVGLHNLFHYVDEEMSHKPVLPVGVSSGRGGRYPLQQMRTMGYKNKHFVVIPESLFFDHVEKNLVDGALTDERAIARTDYALTVLIEYAKSLRMVRESGVIDHESFASGV